MLKVLKDASIRPIRSIVKWFDQAIDNLATIFIVINSNSEDMWKNRNAIIFHRFFSSFFIQINRYHFISCKTIIEKLDNRFWYVPLVFIIVTLIFIIVSDLFRLGLTMYAQANVMQIKYFLSKVVLWWEISKLFCFSSNCCLVADRSL